VLLTGIARRRLRVILPCLLTLILVGPLAYLWQASWLPGDLPISQMGYADYGGGPATAGHQHQGGTVSVPDLIVDPERPADVRVDLVARQETLTVGGRSVPGFTVNGTSPGPTITATQGQLIEVHAANESVAAGVALHWHGIDVPNAMDGVTGVTQNSIPVGGEFTYRFIADQAGTYWYHSHQVANAQVIGGLLGALIVKPRGPATSSTVDVVATAHAYGAQKTINGQPGDLRVPAKPGQRVRVRVINTDNGLIQTWASTPYQVLAIDGTEVNQPTDVTDRAVTVTGGGRADLGLMMPADGSAVRVQVSRGTAVILGSGDAPPAPQPAAAVDLLHYGAPAPLGFDPAAADRHFTYSIGHRPGFVRGRPGLFWSINGHLYPHTPMFMVRDGDIATMRIDNHSGEVHPMHLHGHHAVVLARNGVAATGSPWWFDSLNVADKETYDIAFVADNPGLWMDHCHNLKHAADGMVAHLMYEGVTTPYVIGGPQNNQPE
jgi:FtsP/CotA-like multicopper oxidase with cupredoxin domain